MTASENTQRGGVDLADLVGALTLVVYSVTASISFAALVFRGPVADGLPRGAATFLVTSGVITILLGLRTTFPIAFGVVQDTAAIVLLPAIAAIVDAGSDDPVRDVFVVLTISSFVTGAVMLSLGSARLGGLVRFMPTTVVAGFLAGTGWLLFKGGFDVMTRRSLGLGDLDDLFSSELLKFWLPGLVLGLVIVGSSLMPRVPPLISGLATVIAAAVFFVVVALTSSVDAVEAGGWLLGPFPTSGTPSFTLGEFRDADWSAVAGTVGPVGVVVILSLFGLLLNVSGIQSLLRTRVDIDAELRTAGLANIVVSPIGGLVGYHGLGDSSLADRVVSRRRWVPVAVGGSTVIVAFASRDVIGLIPQFVAGGLLIGAGVGLLVAWFGELRATSAWLDRAVSVVILSSIVVVGILEGIVIGIVAACLFFVVRYSRIDPIRVVSTGAERRSVVERSDAEAERLDELAGRLAVYELHGSLFFGSVNRIAETVRQRLARTGAPVDVIIIDFERVTDVDSSAVTALGELADELGGDALLLVWSAIDDRSRASIERSVGRSLAAHTADLDAALELAEDHLLAHAPASPAGGETAGETAGEKAGGAADGAPSYSDALLGWFDERHYDVDSVVVAEGGASDELIVLMQGSVVVSRQAADDRVIRLRSLRAPTILGEIGFLTGGSRTASVIATEPIVVRVLTAASFERLRTEHPDLAIELYEHVLRSTADRAASIHRSLTQAMR